MQGETEKQNLQNVFDENVLEKYFLCHVFLQVIRLEQHELEFQQNTTGQKYRPCCHNNIHVILNKISYSRKLAEARY